MRNTSVRCVLTALLLGLTLSAAARAGCSTVQISDGAKVCLTPEHATADICTSGTTASLAKFQVFWGATTTVATVAGGSNQVAGSGVPVASFTADFDSFADPGLFPGYFVICAKNPPGSGIISVTLCVHPDVTGACPPAGS